jgi:hypothetical protein
MTGTTIRKPCCLVGNDTGRNKRPVRSLPGSPAPKAGDFFSARTSSGRSGMKVGRRIRKPYARTLLGTTAIALTALLLSVLLPQALSAREDSARLVFQKSAGPRKTRLHVVKKGEFITGIFRSQRGNEPVPFALIRQLNPALRNLNRIYPGQQILLPVRDTADLLESSTVAPMESASPPRTYSIREGDSISWIILAELDVAPAEVLPAYRLLRRMNPDIADMNQLPAGQLLRLPRHLVRSDRTAAEPLQTVALPPEQPAAEPAITTPPATERLLEVIRPVISRMRGTLTAAGNYFIPLKDTAQVTIDCSLIPVIELDDGSTVFLDFGNRLSDNLKGLIRQSWTNYAFLSAEELRDDIASLQGIIGRSRNYTMSRVNTPLALSAKPEIRAFPDWIIAAKKAVGGALYRQGLFLLGGSERPLPAGAGAVLEKNGLIVTEIAEGDTAAPLALAPAPPILDLRALKGIAFAEELLKTLDEAPLRNAGVVVFEQARDGFNLSVTADLLLRRGDKRYLIQTKPLPDQFIRILKDQGTEVILLRDNDSRRPLIEELLQRLNISVSFGHFSFRIPEEGNRPRLITTFSALRATAGGESLYLLDFDISPEVLSLIQGRLGGRVAKY